MGKCFAVQFLIIFSPPPIYRKKHLVGFGQSLSKKEYRALQPHVQVNSFSPQSCKELSNTLNYCGQEAYSSILKNLLYCIDNISCFKAKICSTVSPSPKQTKTDSTFLVSDRKYGLIALTNAELVACIHVSARFTMITRTFHLQYRTDIISFRFLFNPT